MSDSFVSLIIPAYNEEKTVGKVIEETSQIMDRYGLPYEIIVVNDGSTDNTLKIATSTYKATITSQTNLTGANHSLEKRASKTRMETSS